MKQDWPRVSGVQMRHDGTICGVWLAHEPDVDTVHVYDAVLFDRAELAVVAAGFHARSPEIPVAWADEGLRDKLKAEGMRMAREPSNPNLAELITRNMQERMKTGRWKISRHCKPWIEEYQTFSRENGQVPVDTHPLMAATRYAIERLASARAPKPIRRNINARKMAII